MPERSGPDDALAAVGAALAEQVAAAVPAWTRQSVGRVLEAWRASGGPLEGPDARALLDHAEHAGRQAAAVVGDELRALGAADVDAQRSTPLEIVRRAVVGGPTAVLAAAGVPPVVRDRFAEERFPDDPYGLTPASLAALAPGLGEIALAWGAAKAAAHRARHSGSRSEG